ncbi:VenA family class IV lanthipeptide [Yinghuangia seranimata]|nr:VenA family class IV lanthipeptide [Yinghuangia seranimata]MDI2128583.1 VenA family class IV lanthipeptide [Yinghuangia seranimata]
MQNLETDLAALQRLPETESVELGGGHGGGGGGCQFTCLVITCLIFTMGC